MSARRILSLEVRDCALPTGDGALRAHKIVHFVPLFFFFFFFFLWVREAALLPKPRRIREGMWSPGPST